TFADPERFNFNANVAIKSRTNQLQVIAPLSSAADDCFPRARLQPPRKKNHFLRGLQTRAIPANVFGGASNRSPRSQSSSASDHYIIVPKSIIQLQSDCIVRFYALS